MKGNELFVEANGDRHDLAIDAASSKLHTQIEKYKAKLYNKAS